MLTLQDFTNISRLELIKKIIELHTENKLLKQSPDKKQALINWQRERLKEKDEQILKLGRMLTTYKVRKSLNMQFYDKRIKHRWKYKYVEGI